MKTIKLYITILFFGLSYNAIAQETRKVLFLGNSYTSVNNLPVIVADLATSAGDLLIYDSNMPGGYTLQNHFNSTISKDKILSDNWDYVVLQEQSQRPAFEYPNGFRNAFYSLSGYIRQNKPCAIVSAYMTWGHKNGDSQNCAIYPPVCTYTGMQNLLINRYVETAEETNAEVTPVGQVWKYIRENYPSINLYQADGSHPTIAGSYLAACCFYTSIFRKSPILITTNYGLDEEVASIIRNATKIIVYDQMLEWYIGKYVPQSNFNFEITQGINEVKVFENSSLFYDAFEWDFGDGNTSTELKPTHSYASDGTFIIKLTTTKCYLDQNSTATLERTVNFCQHTNTIFPDLILCPGVVGTIWTQPADSYQWCDYLGNPIEGAVNQSLDVYSGEYSVLTTIDGCTERSPKKIVDEYIAGPLPGPEPEPCSLGIIDVNKKWYINVFPNPATNILNFRTENTIKEILIYNSLGQKVNFKKQSNNELDIAHLPQGIYIVKFVAEDDKVNTSKFIKK